MSNYKPPYKTGLIIERELTEAEKLGWAEAQAKAVEASHKSWQAGENVAHSSYRFFLSSPHLHPLVGRLLVRPWDKDSCLSYQEQVQRAIKKYGVTEISYPTNQTLTIPFGISPEILYQRAPKKKRIKRMRVRPRFRKKNG